MALREIKEITDAVDTRGKELRELRDRFENDFELWRLKKYQLGKKDEYDNYTSNEPKTLANKIIEILSSAPLQIRIPLKNEREEERKQISNAERLVYGAINLADSRLQFTAQPSTQEQLAFFSTIRGSHATRAYIHKNNNGEVIPDIAVWDMLHTTWDVGADRMLWVCHTRPISVSQAKAEYDIDIGEVGNAVVYDFWDDEINCAILNGEFVIKPFKHELKHIPVLIGMVGSAPFIQSDRNTDTIKDFGESIYDSNRNLYDHKNKLITELMTIVGQGVHNPLKVKSAGGKKTLEKSPYYKGSVVQLDTEKGEEIEPVWQPTMPRDANALLGAVVRDMSIGGMPPIAFGELNFQLPGYGINLLTHAAASVLLPRQRSMEKTYEWIARELLTQYQGGGFGKLRLHGRDGSNEYFDVEITPEDVKGDWFPEAKLLPSLPEDTAAKYAMAQTAVQNELLSRETARDKLLGVQDPDLETQKILREKALNMPPILLRRMAAALIEEGRPDLARIFEAELERVTAQATPTKSPPEMPRSVVPSEETRGKTPTTPSAEEVALRAEARVRTET